MKLYKKAPGFATVLLASSLVAFTGCGDDGDSTNVIVNPDGPQSEQDGPGTGTGSVPGINVKVSNTVRLNQRVENNVRITDKSKVQVGNRRFVFVWRVRNVDAVIQQQFIHRADRCPSGSDDVNRDGFIDEQELQQVVGPRVFGLQLLGEGQGTSYSFQRAIGLDQLWGLIPPGEDFVVAWYGVNPETEIPSTYVTVTGGAAHLNVPIACKVYTTPDVSILEPGTSTGGTTGGSGDTTENSGSEATDETTDGTTEN